MHDSERIRELEMQVLQAAVENARLAGENRAQRHYIGMLTGAPVLVTPEDAEQSPFSPAFWPIVGPESDNLRNEAWVAFWDRPGLPPMFYGPFDSTKELDEFVNQSEFEERAHFRCVHLKKPQPGDGP